MPPAQPETTTRHLFITGRVQGVGFRWHMTQQARAQGVSGWVRNVRDGRVEAVVSGPPAAVQALIAWAGQGPPGARVDAVAVREMAGTFDGFTQRDTA